MKKTTLILFLVFAAINATIAQQINIDSIVKVVVARNPPKTRYTFNKDSLLKRLPFTKPGPQRVKLINDLFYYGIFTDSKQNFDVGYQILAWTKEHHDLIGEAVIAAELGSGILSNGDKATGLQLEMQAMDAALKSHDNQALGIVYGNAVARVDLSQVEIKNYSFKGLEYSRAAHDTVAIAWAYANLYTYYQPLKKDDSTRYYMVKSLDWSIKANRIYDITKAIDDLAYFATTDPLIPTYFKGAYTIATRTNDFLSIPITASALAHYYLKRNNMDSALVYAKISYQAGKHVTVSFQVDAVGILAKVYIKKRDIDSAVKYLKLYYAIDKQLDNSENTARAQAFTFNQKQRQQQAEADKAELKNSRLRWVLAVVIVFLLFIAFIFWRNNRLSKKANILLSQQKEQTELALANLKSAQQQLVQSEKMASLGELTAGIAHEIQNPLNFVNNFSEVSRELLTEMKEELAAGNLEDVNAIAADLDQNLEKIGYHGKRAEGIVKGMLEHSRASTGIKELTDLNKLADEYLHLAYHGLRAKDKSFNAELITRFDETLPMASVIPQDIGRVLLNLFNNAFYTLDEKTKTAGADYQPKLTVITLLENNEIVISVTDNGIGITDAIKDKIMQPFFTTKPTGQGTGLGLSLSYDIVVKGHGGTVDVKSTVGAGSEFCIKLPAT